jgi:ketosteroid isomerase-like protein
VSMENFNKGLVSGLADALNEHDLIRARNYLADDLHFVGVFGPAIEGVDAYLDAMERLRARQTILKSIVEHDDVACFYELSLPARPDIKLFCCAWFKISNHRISSIRAVFDPAPLGKA